MPFYEKDLLLAVHQTLRALQRRGGGEVVAEDVLVVKYFSCRRIVSRTTRLMMKLQSVDVSFPLPLFVVNQ